MRKIDEFISLRKYSRVALLFYAIIEFILLSLSREKKIEKKGKLLCKSHR